ncbi:MAG: penicillin-binding protein [Deltaproteobacteria bacterium]|nr:penicillin-binding protein [Candidatus Anaeroferrophillus wilburensis]MBN2888985.1 penicillin-binding protein [Deltaproteobacteria bacterium]
MKRPRRAENRRLEHWKALTLAVVLVVGAGGLLTRAYYLQVVRYDFFLARCRCQNSLAVEIRPERGEILDARGKKLAISLETESICVRPQKVENKKQHAGTLARILGLSRQEVYRKLQSKKPFEWLDRDVLPSQAEAVRKLKLKGVEFAKESRRFYPNRELAGQLLGFVGVDNTGLEGLELRYNRHLQGKRNVVFLERDARRRVLDPQGLGAPEGVRGRVVKLTIDRAIQYAVDQELARAVKSSQGARGLALVMDVDSGAVLAMSHYPFFNPNSFSSSQPQIWRNRAIVDVIEPGSTFKVFTVAAALEKGVISPTELIDCEGGKYRVGGRTIHDTHEYDELSAGEIVKFSSNIGCSKIAALLGRQSLYEFLQRCGFGEKTDIDFPGEKPGTLRDWQQWKEIDFCNISFGQGVGVTPVQLASAYAMLANGGYRVKPYLVDQIVDESGWKVYQHHPEKSRSQVLSPAVASQVSAMLEMVVEDDGTAPEAAIPGYWVAGKTGTAQKYDQQKKCYSRSDYLASFIGFIPAPEGSGKLLIYVLIDEPRTSIYGGMVAAPAFRRIGQRVMAYLNVEPSSRVTLVQGQGALPAGRMSLATAPVREEEGVVPVAAGVMPDFSGCSLREVLSHFGTLPGPLKIEGSGRVKKQKPLPGRRLMAGAGIEFVLTAEN